MSNKECLQSYEECSYGLDGFGDVYVNEPNTNDMRMAHAAYALNKFTADNPSNTECLLLSHIVPRSMLLLIKAIAVIYQ